ncbi:peroxiredoxin family protein [Bauldia sp.]|uniref:peroxiredoxin family protein n=1 Tax=Bauldia sp. TaxID=2575872 RepID=UPI003BAC6CBB
MMVGLAICAFYELIWVAESEAWYGAFVASAALPAYMALFLAKGGAARTSPRLIPVQIVAIIGAAVAAYPLFDRNPVSETQVWPLAAAVLSVLGLQWYVFVYSRYGRKKSGAIVAGRPLPDLAFEALDGARVRTSDFIGSKTLLVFFRGNWCPLCMGQLREVRARADRLEAAGVKVKFISNQSPERSRELALKLALPDHFEILHDRELRAAKSLAIEDIGGAPPGLKDFPADTVMATVIGLDAEGRVIYGDETDNYRVRPHPDSFLPVFEAPNTERTPQRSPNVIASIKTETMMDT